MKRVLFFDIDGTIIAPNSKLKDNVRNAMLKARKNGHELILCTGRSIAQLQDEIAAFDFDGRVLISGGLIEYGGKVLANQFMKKHNFDETIKLLIENDISFVVQQGDNHLTNIGGVKKLYTTHQMRFHVSPEAFDRAMGKIDEIDDFSNVDGVNKIMFFESIIDVKEMRKRVNNDLYVVNMSFFNTENNSGEICQAGVDKASGMKMILDHIGMDRESSVGFGDGENDIDMLEFAGVGVAMGNASDYVKSFADMVTDTVEDDGVVTAMEKLQLI